MLRYVTALCALITACFTLSFTLAGTASAQQIDCQDYANQMEAMERARSALGPLPEDQSWEAHYSWCSGAPVDHPRMHFERQIRDFHAFARTIAIRHLRPNFRCESYAIASDAFETALEELNCPIQAFTTDEHRDWCQAGNQDEAINHLTNRRQTLLRCIGNFDYRGPGAGQRNFALQTNRTPPRPSVERFAQRLPQGSYLQTCRNAGVEEGTLFAECETRNGRWRRSSLYLGNYDGPVSNCDGHLRGSDNCD